MEVFILVSSHYAAGDEEFIHGIFSTNDRAMAALSEYNSANKNKSYTADIEVVELDVYTPCDRPTLDDLRKDLGG